MADTEEKPVVAAEDNKDEQKQEKRGSKERGQNSRGGDRGSNQKVKYVKKGQEGEDGEKGDNAEKKYEKRNYRQKREGDENQEGDFKGRRNYDDKKRGGRRQKESKYDWTRENVTAETVIPEKPTKGKELQQPSQEQLEKKLDEVEKQIEDIHLKKRKYLDELMKNNKQQKEDRDKKIQPTRAILKEKQEAKKAMRENFTEKQKAFQDVKSQIDELFDKSSKLRNKMKILKKKDQIEQELAEKQQILHNAYLSSQEEKKLVQQIEALEKSLPHSVPLAAVEEKIDSLSKEKKEKQKEMNAAYAKMKQVEEEIKELLRDMDEVKNFKEENKNNLEPLISEKKAQYAAEIEELKEKKKALKSAHEKARDEWEDQQEFIRHVDWMKRIKDKLVKEIQKQKKEEAQKKKIEEEEKAEKERLAEINPYQEQLELCDMLINYIQLKITPKQQEVAEEQVDRSKILEEKKNELEKEKLEYLVSRREKQDQDDQIGGKRGKKKQQKKPQQKDEQNVNLQITHQVEVLGYFDSVKVPAPLQKDDFPKTLESLKEKKAYFEKAAEDHKIQANKELAGEVEAENKEGENKEGEEAVEKQDSSAKIENVKKPKKTQKSVNVDDEEEFPTMG